MLGRGGDRFLHTYLNDHRTGAIAGRELARRTRGANEGTELGRFLDGLVADIESDLAALEDVMDRVGAPRDRLKQAAAVTAERLGRLKLNGELFRYSPLSRLIELEGLALGVEGKASLWRSLKAAADPRLEGVDLDVLVTRAEAQRAGLERHRVEAARVALAESS